MTKKLRRGGVIHRLTIPKLCPIRFKSWNSGTFLNLHLSLGHLFDYSDNLHLYPDDSLFNASFHLLMILSFVSALFVYFGLTAGLLSFYHCIGSKVSSSILTVFPCT